MSQLNARRANHAYGMDAMCVAEILLEEAAVRLHPWSNDIGGGNRRLGGGICAGEETATLEKAL